MIAKKKVIDLGDIKLAANDFVERATGLIAKRGKGKSGLLKVVEEELLQLDLPFVVFDPTGIHWGIKSSYDGSKPSGFEVLVIGGPHGDLPLDRQAGRIVARAFADTYASLIVDFKGSSHAVYRQFVADFSDELLDINKVPRLLILEEAPRLLPQKLRPDQTQSFDAVARLILEGRNSGLGCILVSQRAATINKDVLTQVDNMIVMGLTGPQDRKAIKEWVEENAEPELLDKFLSGLAGLKPREGWLWSPDMDIFQKFWVKDFKTFHPDRTHLRKMGLLESSAVVTDTQALVKQLGEQLQQFAEEAKANDPAELKREIAKLKKELQTRPAQTQTKAETKIERVEVPVISDTQMEAITKALATLQENADHIIEMGTDMKTFATTAGETLTSIGKNVLQFQKQTNPGPRPVIGIGRTKVREQAVKTVTQTNNGLRANQRLEAGDPVYVEGLTNPQQRILDSMAWIESIGLSNPKRNIIAFLAGQSPKSSGFTNNLGALRSAGLITYPSSDSLAFTEAGRTAANPQEAPITSGELHNAVFSRLPRPQANILMELIEDYPNPINREELAQRAGQSPTSSGYTNNLGALRSLGVIDYPSSTEAVALPVLFLE